jgi:hypothetical protein
MSEEHESNGSYPHAMPLKEKHVRNCRVFPNRANMLECCYPLKAVGAEVGVLAGDFSKKILEILKPKKLYLIDLYNKSQTAKFGKRDGFEADEHLGYVTNRFKSQVKDETVIIQQGCSWELLEKFEDEYFDFLYIDANHQYDAVKKDLEVSRKKIKEGGLIGLNDYIFYDHVNSLKVGVVEAVNEFCNKYDFEIVCFAFSTRMYCDVTLREIRQ